MTVDHFASELEARAPRRRCRAADVSSSCRAGVAAAAAILLTGCASASSPPAPQAKARTAVTGHQAAAAHVVGAAKGVQAATAPFRLPETLSRAVALPGRSGHLLVIGGLHDGERSTNAVLDVDLAATVRVLGRLPIPVHDAAGALLNGVPTMFGGGNSADVAAVQQVVGATTSVVGRLPVATSDPVAVATGRGVIVVGGYDGTQTLGQVLLITGPTHVARLGTLAVPVRYAAVGVLGSGSSQRVLIVGGESRGVATDAVQQLDPATGRVALIGRLPAARTQASALTLGSSLFVFGGASAGNSTGRTFADVLRWDPKAKRFVAVGVLPYPVADAAAVTLNGREGYLVGGESPARVATTITVTAR